MLRIDAPEKVFKIENRWGTFWDEPFPFALPLLVFCVSSPVWLIALFSLVSATAGFVGLFVLLSILAYTLRNKFLLSKYTIGGKDTYSSVAITSVYQSLTLANKAIAKPLILKVYELDGHADSVASVKAAMYERREFVENLKHKQNTETTVDRSDIEFAELVIKGIKELQR